MQALVVAPHSDDETLGCGGTIAKHAQSGHEVHVCIVTRGSSEEYTDEFLARRDAEIDAAAGILGVSEVHKLGYTATDLADTDQTELNADLGNVINGVKPDVLYLPHGDDLHRDHRETFEAALVAARPHQTGIRRILCYETLSETEWGTPIGDFSPNVYVDIADFVETKIEAMKAYETAIKEFPHPRSVEGIRHLSARRGTEVCLPAAEAFSLVREVQSDDLGFD
jgi:LmbE family N-acetylglucosaminyl deacetylase